MQDAEEKTKEKDAKKRQERKNREAFKVLLKEHQEAGKITARTGYVFPHIRDRVMDPIYLTPDSDCGKTSGGMRLHTKIYTHTHSHTHSLTLYRFRAQPQTIIMMMQQVVNTEVYFWDTSFGHVNPLLRNPYVQVVFCVNLGTFFKCFLQLGWMPTGVRFNSTHIGLIATRLSTCNCSRVSTSVVSCSGKIGVPLFFVVDNPRTGPYERCKT
jgi:hypothetical protein